MPSAASPNPRAGSAAPNELDNFFNYDEDVDNFLKDLPLDKDAQNNTAPQEPTKDIDEEVTIKKKRKPVPKLDENRILSQQGIPKLRKITKSRLKFKGKGHEFSDISRLLNTYQLWLDDLYPRAKFRDALAMVEKVGHSKRMQVTRRAWIDATKPHQREESPTRVEDVEMSGALPGICREGRTEIGAEQTEDALFGVSAQPREDLGTGHRDRSPVDVPEEDELDALLAEDATADQSTSAVEQPNQRGPFEEDEPDEDELDALLAEQQPTSLEQGSTSHEQTTKANSGSGSFEDDEFADEEEALASMGGMW